MKHFDQKLPIRVICDASLDGLGTCLQQEHPNEGWCTIAYASRFLNKCEQRYSVNELELLGVVWSCEYFRHYLYGAEFTVLTDHKALLSLMNSHHGNKTYQSRLTRWIDRLLPFNFKMEHIAGTKMGLVDYISRNPVGKADPELKYDTSFIVASINNIKRNIAKALVDQRSTICSNLK